MIMAKSFANHLQTKKNFNLEYQSIYLILDPFGRVTPKFN
jgi:hypothetical protein